MLDRKHHVFSARTTKEGLQALAELKSKLGVGWDGLVIGAVCAHYGLDRNVMAVPKKEKPDRPKLEDRTVGKAKDRKKGEADERGKRQRNGQKGTIRA